MPTLPGKPSGSKSAKAVTPSSPALKNVQTLIFDAPLYTQYSITDEQGDLLLGGGIEFQRVIDGFCPVCKLSSTFKLDKILTNSTDRRNILGGLSENKYHHNELKVSCNRNYFHVINIHLRFNGMTVQKIGQFPSLADIANFQLQHTFRRVLEKHDSSELYKAVGLASHGEGIGAFVYLRRVFERLLKTRFEDFQSIEGWGATDFDSRRIEDKIDLLKEHLPSFLVENRRLYKILSVGVHELDNDACLQFFEIGKESIVMMLEEDLKNREDQERRKKLTAAVAAFGTTKESK